MDEPLSHEALVERLHARVARRLAPLLWALAAGFAFFALVTLAFRPPGATLLLVAVDGGGALALGAAALWIRRRPPRPHRANAIAGGALLLTLAASLVAIKALHLPAQTTNVLIVQLVGSVILLSPAWVALLVLASLAGWAGVAASEGWGEAWLNAGFALVATSIMSAMIQHARLRDARASEALGAANEEKAERLERAYRAERDHVRALASANDSLEAFAHVVSHDLKEPLRGMGYQIQDLEERIDGPERREALARLAHSHEHLSRLVQGLLEWSRVATAPLRPEPVSVPDLLNDPTTRVLFERLLAERRAKLLVEPDLPTVLGTPALVRQVLGNLVLNAVRHNGDPEPQVRVYAARDAPAGMVDIVVEDNGPGYPQHVVDAAGSLKDRPTGMKGGFGLSIAHRAVDRLGGSLHLENAPGGGARAHVLLPAPDVRGEAFARRVRELV